MTREEAIRRIKAWNLDADDMEVISEVIPELKESEDERIRIELLAVINDLVLPDEQKARFNAWLEKQKEQKMLAVDLEKKIWSSAPTQSLAMKWLREVHKLHIWIAHKLKQNKGLPWYYEIHNIETGTVVKIGDVVCGSYEAACEAAIKYCLENLI